MFDFRMRMLRIRHLPPVRAVLAFPDRLDESLMRVWGRLARRCEPWLSRARAVATAGIGWGGPRLASAKAGVEARARRVERLMRRVPGTCWLGLLMTGLTVVPSKIAPFGVPAICAYVGVHPTQLSILPAGAVDSLFVSALFLSRVLLVLLPAAAFLAFVRVRMSLVALKAGAVGCLLFVLLLWRTTVAVPSLLNEASADIYPNLVRNELWVQGGWRVLPWVLVAGAAVVCLSLRSVASLYGRRAETPNWADRLWGDLRRHGADPAFRKTLYASAAIHLFLIFVLPFITGPGCNELPYGIPLGSGTPVIEVKIVKKVKKKPEKKYVLNMNAAISFYIPKIEDSEVLEEMDKQTENTYEAQQLGKLGAGGGKQGGWPNGMKNSRVRFIRLEYDGGDWNQDMGVGADYNMLLKFRDKTGFDIATETESRPIAQLKRFPKNRAPPFVYLTGGLRGRMNISQSEVKVLRSYCLEMGGLLFADNGGGQFDSQFRALMKRTFPELRLVEISKDDVLFQQPFYFPSGAPPLWHHSGNNALGIKYKGRWVVFYHQGDINDAWKTGHSGASSGVAEQAYKLGVNVINYAFNQYMSINFGGTVPK